MAGDVINLRQARKTRERAVKEKQAAENRVKYGRTKDERRLHDANNTLSQQRIEGHKRDAADPKADSDER
jgi:hypothetical protein